MSSSVFVYYKFWQKLLSPMLGTCTETSIYHEHVLKVAQKRIKQANKLFDRVTKALKTYVGEQIPPEKELAELQGCVRTYQELVGWTDEIPTEIEPLLAYAAKLKIEYDKLIKEGKAIKATVFMRDADKFPQISTHMIIGNIKENLRIVTNNSLVRNADAEEAEETETETEDEAPKKGKKAPKKGKKPLSKVQIGEMMALDIKPVEHFVKPSQDIIRDEEGDPELLERSVRFPSKQGGGQEVAIIASEMLPIGTEWCFHLRVRRDSPLLPRLEEIFDYGKSNGMGQWRGSGGMGQYCYKLEQVDYDPTPIPDGWR